MEGVAVEVPRAHEFHFSAGFLRPGVSVRDRGVNSECEDAECKEHTHQEFSDHWLGWKSQALNAVCEEVEFLAERKDGKVERREVMVEEQLSSHQEEWEVMEEPSKHIGTNFIIKALEGNVAVIPTMPLPSNN